jgi:mRNA-degrading endonuclease toxin of MazEF toxin-antitoxin module
MDALAEQLDAKLREWTPETAAQVRQQVAEIIALADQDVLDVTTQHRHSPYEVVLPRLPFLGQNSVANVQGLGSLPTVRLERRLGMLPDTIMAQIKRALAFVLDLSAEA